MFGGAFDGRRVFVTGHTGFKGAWLTSWLFGLGAEVTGYALPPATEPSLFDALDLAARVRHVVADVRDRDRLSREMAAARPSIVFHLAAQPLVRRSYAEPHETFATNVMGTVDVLEAARACDSVEAVVIVTSDKCYRQLEDRTGLPRGRPTWGARPVQRQQRLRGAGHRRLPRQLLRRRPAGRGRLGPRRERHRRRRLGAGPDHPRLRARPGGRRPVVVRNPDAVRPWQHVLEPLAGYLSLAAHLVDQGSAFAGAWNFGPDDEDASRPVRWVVERFLDAWGAGTWATPQPGAPQPHEARSLALDSGKARERLGWAPVWDAAAAVGRTAAWYREYYRRPGAARALVEEQLLAYARDAGAAGRAWAAEAGTIGRSA